MTDIWSPPSEFEEYRLVRLLGQGEMGQVYLAWDDLLARHVAVKFVSAVRPDETQRQRFLTEARAAARVQHPNVVAVFRVGELDARPYLITEFVRGETLDRIAKPVPWTRALEIGIDLARGLAAAHRKGVLHRDLKPANAILAEDGTAKLLDFGLAKLLEEVGVEAADVPASAPPPAGPGAASRIPGAGSRFPGAASRIPGPAIWIPGDRDTGGAAATIPPEAGPPGDRDSGGAAATIPPEAGPPGDRLASELARWSSLESRKTAQLTRVGAVMGTPDYMSPEAWRGEPSTRRSDVYSLGALLFELCAGEPPHAAVSLADLPRVVQERDAPSLATVPDVDARFAAIVDRCLRRDPAERFASGDELREALERLARVTTGGAIPAGNPYRGLRPFEAEHRALFFGRNAEIGLVLDRLRSESFVVVAGESGVGKSSLCRAGVLPQAAAGALSDGRRWSVVSMVPGRHPLFILAALLAPELAADEHELADRIRTDPVAVLYELRRVLGQDRGLVIFVDQIEELVTMADPGEAAAADNLLARLASRVPGVRLLATARADLLSRLADLPGLGEEMTRGLYFLRPLAPDRLREVIVGPAEATGIRFESEALIDTLVESTARAHGALPLLQFALAELWEARDRERGVIRAAALEAIGGVGGALSRHADSVIAALSARDRAIARAVLTRLVTPQRTRTRRTARELCDGDPDAPAVLDALVRGRLLVAHEVEGTSAFEITHEVLIQSWATLASWLHEDADRLAVRERALQAAAEWERLGRAREALWGAAQLAEVARVGLAVEAPMRAFLDASRRAVRRARWGRIALVAAVPLLVGTVWGVVRALAAVETDRKVAAEIQRAEAALARAAVVGGRAERRRMEAFGWFHARDVPRGEAVWETALAAAAEEERLYALAAQALEAALAHDHARKDVRNRFADLLLARALVAERAGRLELRDELVQRLGLYDEGGERLARWNAPARLSVETAPAGAAVRLERYVEDERRNRRLEPVRELGTTPLQVSLPRGSYRLVLSAPGRARVVAPVLLGRGTHRAIRVALPRKEAIPPGMVYVPAGRFLFGSAADEEVRRGFYEAPPLHETRTGPYLIGRTEVTFGEWIEFLEALPPEERALRTPRIERKVGGATGALGLERDRRGVWRIRLQPAQRVYEAAAGQPIRYEGRDRRAVQDWRRFPVTGISARDAEAYVAWLRATGRVPRARLCSELEWERAARGADDREYPHGHFLGADDANHDATYGKGPRMGPDEVGSHPRSRSPFGLDDMSGNAWEWTTSAFSASGFVARGGSYFYDQKTCRVVNRQVSVPTLRDGTLGLRVCADAPPP